MLAFLSGRQLTWQFDRVNNQMQYISVTVNGQMYPLDLYKANESYWPIENITGAFQMDGDYAQQPYNVWLDKATLTHSNAAAGYVGAMRCAR